MIVCFILQRSILYDLKDEIVPPTNETVAQVFARLSAYRDAMDGPQVYLCLLHKCKTSMEIIYILCLVPLLLS